MARTVVWLEEPGWVIGALLSLSACHLVGESHQGVEARPGADSQRGPSVTPEVDGVESTSGPSKSQIEELGPEDPGIRTEPADSNAVGAAMPGSSRNGLSCSERDTGFGCIRGDGRVVIPFQYIERPIQFKASGLALVNKRDAGWVFIDEQNQVVFAAMTMDNMPDEYDERWVGLSRFRNEKGKIGFVDSEYRVTIPARYDAAFMFEGDTTRVCVGCHPLRWSKDAPPDAEETGEDFWIDRHGRRVDPPAAEKPNPGGPLVLSLPRVDHRGHRVFLAVSPAQVDDQRFLGRILGCVAAFVREQGWSVDWYLSIFSETRFIGYEGEKHVRVYIEDGSWPASHLAEYTNQGGRLVRFPLNPKDRTSVEITPEDFQVSSMRLTRTTMFSQQGEVYCE